MTQRQTYISPISEYPTRSSVHAKCQAQAIDTLTLLDKTIATHIIDREKFAVLNDMEEKLGIPPTVQRSLLGIKMEPQSNALTRGVNEVGHGLLRNCMNRHGYIYNRL